MSFFGSGSVWANNSTPTSRHRLLVDLSAAQSAAEGAVVQGTNAKQVHAWTRFQRYLGLIGVISDPYLDNFSQFQRSKILSAFAHSLREGQLSDGNTNKTLKSDSIRAALDHISQAFKLADRPDPRLDRDGKPALFLQRQLRGYRTLDPPIKPQVALTASILRQFYLTSISHFDRNLCELFIGAFFFAMRSCEYIQVSGPRKTKLLCLHNIKFIRKKKTVSHTHQDLHKADCVTITFELQKRVGKNDMITQHRSSDSLLCPVKIWAKIVKRLISYHSSTKDTTVNTYCFPNGSTHLFTNKELLQRIRKVAASIGKDELGFSPEEIGLHSARSGAAMAMYLAGVPVFTIMLLG